MEVKIGKGRTQYGPGVEIKLTGDELARAVLTYLTAQGVHHQGPITISVNNELCREARVYVDPAGFVVADGKRYEGSTGKIIS